MSEKRYFIVNEFFGIRVYDCINKTEQYFNEADAEQIKTQYSTEFEEINLRPSKKGKLYSPLKISMNITKKCNLRCEQCFSESGDCIGNELDTYEIYALLDNMRKNGTFFICIGGGEPFMRADIFDIFERGKNNHLAISVVTNGTLITEKLISKLNECNLDTLWISLEGLKDNHDRLRGAGTFEKALQALALLRKYYQGRTAIRVSLSKLNINECISLINVAEEYSVDIIRFTPLLEFGRATGKGLTVDQEQYIRFRKMISKVESKVQIIYPDMIDKGKFWIDKNGFGCHCGKEAIWIDEEGNYSPCIFFGEDYIIGNIRTSDYLELWEKALDSVSFEGNATCKSCDNYAICRGGCRARALNVYGDINAVDPICPLRKNKISC